MDYIEESKGLSKKGGISEDDYDESIKESIQQEGDDDDDSIEEEIEEGINSKSKDESSDYIKESIHVNGKKVQHQKDDKGLEKMRLALGSEEAIRK